MSKIKPKEYWLINDGSVVFVLNKLEGSDSWWLVNKLDSKGNWVHDFSVAEVNFERKLFFQEARELANKFFKKSIEGFFEDTDEFSKSAFYVIQGIFFQKGSVLVNEKGIDGDDSCIFRGQFPTFFSGYIFPDLESRSNLLKGEIREWTLDVFQNIIFRKSIIWDVLLDPEFVSFNKVYSGQKKVIAYSFEEKKGNIWIGKCEVGEFICDAKCIITEVPEDFFHLPTLLQD